MLTYREYFNRMSAICSAFNTALSTTPNVTITGLNEQENILYKAGQYVMTLAQSEDSVFSQNSVGVLLKLSKAVEGYFEFGLFPPEDVEEQSQDEAEWRNQFNAYARMRKQTFIGTCFTLEPIIDYNGHTDVTYWTQQQAEHLANYCVSHDLDCELLRILNS